LFETGKLVWFIDVLLVENIKPCAMIVILLLVMLHFKGGDEGTSQKSYQNFCGQDSTISNRRNF